MVGQWRGQWQRWHYTTLIIIMVVVVVVEEAAIGDKVMVGMVIGIIEIWLRRSLT